MQLTRYFQKSNSKSKSKPWDAEIGELSTKSESEFVSKIPIVLCKYHFRKHKTDNDIPNFENFLQNQKNTQICWLDWKSFMQEEKTLMECCLKDITVLFDANWNPPVLRYYLTLIFSHIFFHIYLI